MTNYGNTNNPSQTVPTGGALFAYDTSLNLLWCTLSSCTSNSSAFTLGSPSGYAGSSAFGLPTMANGYIYIPTYGVTAVTGSSTCTSTPCNGLVVYNGN
jgi:hypothetical protein